MGEGSDWCYDFEDESIISFLDMMYEIHINADFDFAFSRKEFYKQFYNDLKAFKNGEW